jgi:hypothetical protein
MAQFQHTNSKGVTYFLNMKEVTLRGGKRMSVYFFTIDQRPATAVEALPADMEIRENPRNGFLTVVREGAERKPFARVGDDDLEEED